MAQEPNQCVGELDSTKQTKILELIWLNDSGGEENKVKLIVRNSTPVLRILEVARARSCWGNEQEVEVRFNSTVLQENQTVGVACVPNDTKLYVEKVEPEQPEEAPKVETDYEPLDQENDEPPKRDSTPEMKKQINQLWKWYRDNNMQLVSHIGDEETDDPWKRLHGIKKKDLAEDLELLNHMAALHDQYLYGFTGPAKRQRTL